MGVNVGVNDCGDGRKVARVIGGSHTERRVKRGCHWKGDGDRKRRSGEEIVTFWRWTS